MSITPPPPEAKIPSQPRYQFALLKGYGMASLEHRLTTTPEIRFQAGSVSRQFTAFTVYLLKKQHKLSLENNIRRYLPHLPDYGTPNRTKHLLAHTSGLPDPRFAVILLSNDAHFAQLDKAESIINQQPAPFLQPASASSPAATIAPS